MVFFSKGVVVCWFAHLGLFCLVGLVLIGFLFLKKIVVK